MMTRIPQKRPGQYTSREIGAGSVEDRGRGTGSEDRRVSSNSNLGTKVIEEHTRPRSSCFDAGR